VSVEKQEKNPKRRHWDINVYRGLNSGTQVSIKPAAAMPHRAMVEVSWHTRLLDIMMKGFAVLSLPIFILLFLGLAFGTRLGFALILTVIIGFVWALAGVIVMIGVAKVCSAIFGNEFDYGRRSTMATEIKSIALPTQTDSAP
jgi:hypothetical protein